MTTYLHRCNNCEHEWDEVYGMSVDPPTLCPECNVDGKVERLISGGSGRGIVVLTGHDLKQQLRVDGAAARKRAQTDENYRANIVGESKYHDQQLNKDSLQSDLAKIGKDNNRTKSKISRRINSK